MLNLFVNIGYGVIGCILSGQLLQAVSGGGLNISVGIVVVVVLGFFVSFLGYHFLQHYDRYAWAFVAVILVVHWAQAARYFPADITYHELQDEDYVGVGLSYFAIIFGQCVAWSSVAGDYYVHYPVNVSRVKVFALTWLGQTVPTLFVGLLGVYLGGALYTNADVGEMYETGGIGAVILGTMRPAGFSKFVGIVYVFSFSELPVSPKIRLLWEKSTHTNSFQSRQPLRDPLLERAQHANLRHRLLRGAALPVGAAGLGRHAGAVARRPQRLPAHPGEPPPPAGLLDHLLRHDAGDRTLPLPPAAGRLRPGRVAGLEAHALGAGRRRDHVFGNWAVVLGHESDLGTSDRLSLPLFWNA